MKYLSSSSWLLSCVLLFNQQPQLVLGQALLDVAEANGLTYLVEAAVNTGQDQFLNGNIPLTVFAPSNEAFEAWPNETLECLTELDQGAPLNAILGFHVVVGSVLTSADIMNETVVQSAIKVPLFFEVDETTGNVMINNKATITEMDLKSDSGVIHVIDTVLLPPGIVLSEICPTIDFGNNPNGDGSMTSDEPVFSKQGNGTVSTEPGIFEVANATGQFTILLEALEKAGLSDQLNNPGPFTVFAPVDDAFSALPNLEELLSNPAKIIPILTNHVVGGMKTEADLVDGETLVPIGQEPITVKIEGSDYYVNDALIVVPDLIGYNGVVHGIDKVLGLEYDMASSATSSSSEGAATPSPTDDASGTSSGGSSGTGGGGGGGSSSSSGGTSNGGGSEGTSSGTPAPATDSSAFVRLAVSTLWSCLVFGVVVAL